MPAPGQTNVTAITVIDGHCPLFKRRDHSSARFFRSRPRDERFVSLHSTYTPPNRVNGDEQDILL